MERTAWSHASVLQHALGATLGLLEISFFLNKDSKEVNLNSFKLAKADIFDGIIGEAIFRK